MAEDMALISLDKWDASVAAVKARDGDNTPITSATMPSRIRGIPGPKPEQEYVKKYTSNGDYPITPEDGKVVTGGSIEVAVPAPKLQSKTLTPTKQTQTATPDAGFYGLLKAIVNPIPKKYPDVSGDTVTPEKLAKGITAHNKAGDPIIGTMPEGCGPWAKIETETWTPSETTYEYDCVENLVNNSIIIFGEYFILFYHEGIGVWKYNDKQRQSSGGVEIHSGRFLTLFGKDRKKFEAGITYTVIKCYK